jgi:hypothetical protein
MAQLTSTNLPIILITTPSVIGGTQIQGSLSIIDNASGINTPTDVPVYSGMIGINVRGSATNPKSSYTLETWSVPGVSLDTALLGMPSDNDFVLMSMYEDRSLMRNILALRLHDQMGRYAPRMRHCEVLINNQYAGIYTFGETVKRGAGRLGLANLGPTDNAGIDLTGGYIFKIDGNGDGWTSAIAPPYATTQQINFEYDYPKANDITPVQRAYIKSYVDSFETAMNGANFQDTLVGWRRFGAVNSFIDVMIMQELSRNNEAYRKNTFMYKDKGTKLRPGPLWNFDLAWRNTADCNSSLDTGWTYQLGAFCGTNNKLAPFWWQKLTQDTLFMEDLKCRYTNYRRSGQLLDTTKIFSFIDSVSTKLNAANAVSRNFTQWPIWGVPLVNEPLPMATTYSEEITNLKTFIKARLAYLDSKWTSTSPTCYPTGINPFSDNVLHVEVYPNPVTDLLQVRFPDSDLKGIVRMFTIQGSLLSTQPIQSGELSISMSNYKPGIYVLQVQTSMGNYTRRIVKE